MSRERLSGMRVNPPRRHATRCRAALRLSLLLSLALSVPAIASAQAGDGHARFDASTWKPALRDSFRLLLIEHGTRMLQPSARRSLEGAFLADYVKSVRIPKTWEDSDSWTVNYLGHPVHGASAARIWIDHLPESRRTPDFGSRRYWADRGIATAWAAGYSLQFEFGLLSEASIGNVGLDPTTAGWVDHVVTPVGALAMTVAEDALDRYFVALVERHTDNRVFKVILRTLFNPSRSLALAAEGRLPWARDGRPLRR
jgi:hypothetical protein